MKYKVNYTASCRWYFHIEKVTFPLFLGEHIKLMFSIVSAKMQLQGCDVNELIKFLSNQMNGTEVCDRTGNQCVVPIFRYEIISYLLILIAIIRTFTLFYTTASTYSFRLNNSWVIEMIPSRNCPRNFNFKLICKILRMSICREWGFGITHLFENLICVSEI